MSETEYLKSNVFQWGKSERKLSADYIIIYFFYVWISSLNQMHILYNFKKACCAIWNTDIYNIRKNAHK